MLGDPKRLKEIRAQLRPEQEITYFDPTENRDIAAKVIKLGRTRLLVEHLDNQVRWEIPLYFINLNQVNTDIKLSSSNKRGLDRIELKIGDEVGFQDDQNNDLYGEVIRLNPKTVTVIVNGRKKWRVPYSLLHAVIRG